MDIRSATATTDPESGIIYVFNNAADFSGTRTRFSFEIKTKDYNATGTSSSIDIDMVAPITWSSSLKSILFLQSGRSNNRGLYIYTSSKARERSNGWDMVSGDQFILWSGYSTSNDSISNRTIIYDMKNESWVLIYTVPSPSSPGCIALPPTTPSTQDTVRNPGDTSSTGEKPHVTVAIAIGVLLVISATIVLAYLRVTKQMKAADDNGIAPHSY
ncbi:MAG: hypothetical protein J3Q66DRAFT_407468 [Benniella sp.]|nr:MAG: hypothetical protein J3Q66DRAFT_407468 [Benniella sp.]